MGEHKTFVGLDVGTSKICSVIAQQQDDESISVVSIGEVPSAGVRKGEIVDCGLVTEAIRECLFFAEEQAEIPISSVWMSITGEHIKSLNHRGFTTIKNEKTIQQEDINMAEINAKEVEIPISNRFLHTILQNYHVDGIEVDEPLDMHGKILEANFHIIHGIETRIQNMLGCMKTLNIEVKDLVVSSLASSQILISQSDKNIGVLLIDIGGGTTDYLLYVDGIVKYTGVLAVGGDHITNDICIGLHLSPERAEKLKIEFGFSEDASYSIKKVSMHTSPKNKIDQQWLSTIIYLRVCEIFELVKQDIEKQEAKVWELLGAGVLITGGCANLEGLESVASKIFKLPIRIVRERNIGNTNHFIDNPRFSTVLGLTQYAFFRTQQRIVPTFLQKISHYFQWILGIKKN